MTTEVTDPPGGRIEPVDLRAELSRSYLDYAMSVIVGRALPDVRDGLKPVHRRVLFAMFDGGYRPDRAYSKSARIVGDVMGNYHPHGDSAIYDTLVRLAQDWVLRYPLVDGQGNFGSPGNDAAAAMRYTESRMAALAMEMVRDIDEETVDFTANYDGRTLEPVILPSRFPNLLVNGSSGIAVGMATNIPPHNLREVAAGIDWALAHPQASSEELLAALVERIKGPDFPTGGLIVGRSGIEDAYRTGRGAVTMRAVVEVEEGARGQSHLVITQLPYQVNPDNLKQRIAELVDSGRITGIVDIRDDSSSRTGMRIVIVLRRDAIATVVLNNLHKHTQLQETFGANMLALVDGVPRTLRLDQFIRAWVEHQIEVIQRRTRYRLAEAERRAHILRAYLAALDALDAVIALIRASATAEDARTGLQELLSIDEVQATAILDMQLRRLAALERQRILDEYQALMDAIADFTAILASDDRQREIVRSELAEITERFGDERRTRILPAEGDLAAEDLIAQEDVVISITRAGYVKRTRTDLYRAQHRGGRGVRGAALRGDDVVAHLLLASTHDWVLFFTNEGRVYRTRAHEIPEGTRDAKGRHVANLLAFQPQERIAGALTVSSYDAAAYLVIATRAGMVKKTPLVEYDSTRAGGVIAIRLREGDEVIAARLVGAGDDLICVSRSGMSVRFHASDASLRPMGRATSGVIGMRLRDPGDALLAMEVVVPGGFLVTVTERGAAKRTALTEWHPRSRGTLGVLAVRLTPERGSLIGAIVASAEDTLFAIAAGGTVLRTRVAEIRPTSRATVGVSLMTLDSADTLVAIAAAAEPHEPGPDPLP